MACSFEYCAKPIPYDGKHNYPMKSIVFALILMGLIKPSPATRINGLSQQQTWMNETSIHFNPSLRAFLVKYQFGLQRRVNFSISNIVVMETNQVIEVAIHSPDQGAYLFYSQNYNLIMFLFGSTHRDPSYNATRLGSLNEPVDSYLQLRKPYPQYAKLVTKDLVGQAKTMMRYQDAEGYWNRLIYFYCFVVHSFVLMGSCCVLGWISNMAWGTGFWILAGRNLINQSVTGLNFVLVTTSWSSYIIYFTSQMMLMFGGQIQLEYYYRKLNSIRPLSASLFRANELFCEIPQRSPMFQCPWRRILMPVTNKDVLYSLNGIIVTTILMLQFRVYKRGVHQSFILGFGPMGMVAAYFVLILTVVNSKEYESVAYKTSLMDCCFLGEFFYSTLFNFRNLFQIFLTFRRKSCDGLGYYIILCIGADISYALKLLFTALNFDDFTLNGETYRFTHVFIGLVFDMVLLHSYLFLPPKTRQREIVPPNLRQKGKRR